MKQRPLRALVVDDSALYRKIVRELLAEAPDVEVVGTASDGKIGLEKIERLQPDLVTLDIAMPRLDGLDVLRRLKECRHHPAVLMLSALTSEGARATTQALRLGAFDFVLKPIADSWEASAELLRTQLEQKARFVKAHIEGTAGAAHVDKSPVLIGENSIGASPTQQPVAVVGIGVSTGGPAALARLLPRFPAGLSVPVLIVQHMPPKFTRSLAEDLNRHSTIQVREAQDGEPVSPATVLIAPGGKQMKVESRPKEVVIQVTDDPPERSCKPAVDYLFRSLSHTYGGGALGVIMTGMGEDGTHGARLLKREGARIIVQDEQSCVVFGMPRCAIQAGVVDAVVPLDRLTDEIVAAIDGSPTCR